MRSFDLFLKDIIDAINSIEEFTQEDNFNTFKNNQMLIDACVRNLSIMGEAATQLPQEIKQKYSQVPWQKIADFRNVVVHKYWVVDKEILWNIIEDELEPLKNQIEAILNEIK